MPIKTFTPEQIVGKLRQIEVLVGQSKTVRLACKEAGVTAQTFYRWRKEYGGLQNGTRSQHGRMSTIANGPTVAWVTERRTSLPKS